MSSHFDTLIISIYILHVHFNVTENLFLGSEALWLGQQCNSAVGFITRYDTKKMVSLKVFVIAYKILKHLDLYMY
jgi:hypothetical protein